MTNGLLSFCNKFVSKICTRFCVIDYEYSIFYNKILEIKDFEFADIFSEDLGLE